MPRTNRNNDINYTIVLINNDKDKVKMLDLTPSSNFRNYRWAIEHAIKNDTKKTNKIVNEIRKYDVNDFNYEKLDFYYGKYTDALKKLQNVSNRLGITSNYQVSKEVIELRDKLIKDTEQTETNETDKETEPITETTETTEIEPQTELITDENGKVKCNECGKFMLKSNLKRHIRNRHSNKD